MKLNLDFVHPQDAPGIAQYHAQNFFYSKQLSVPVFENAIVSAHNGVFVHGKTLPYTWISQDDAQKASMPLEIEQTIDEPCVFIGLFTGIWGHEITDHLKHLWFYFDENYAHLKHLKFVYSLMFAPLDASCNYFELLKMLGIEKTQCLRIDCPTEFKTLYVPEECFFHNPAGYTQEFLNIFQHLPDLPQPQQPAPKIYLSRTKLNSWKDFNEIEVENLFKNQGFTILYPEQLSFSAQLRYFQHAQIFAATDGSIAHNLLFCKPNTTALILRKCRFFTGYQIIINQIKQAQTIYLDASCSPLANRNKTKWAEGIFFLYQSKALRRYFGLKPKMFPVVAFLKAHYAVFRSFNRHELCHFIDHIFLGFTHPLRAKLQLGTRLKKIKSFFFKH